mmetsp:Transcript_51460/g.117355  ORF Transcript_51460/g.117355 Transcript_51460/m.117355 type:complete len:277 (-) Transcript_51460:482-1312(-)
MAPRLPADAGLILGGRRSTIGQPCSNWHSQQKRCTSQNPQTPCSARSHPSLLLMPPRAHQAPRGRSPTTPIPALVSRTLCETPSASPTALASDTSASASPTRRPHAGPPGRPRRPGLGAREHRLNSVGQNWRLRCHGLGGTWGLCRWAGWAAPPPPRPAWPRGTARHNVASLGMQREVPHPNPQRQRQHQSNPRCQRGLRWRARWSLWPARWGPGQARCPPPRAGRQQLLNPPHSSGPPRPAHPSRSPSSSPATQWPACAGSSVMHSGRRQPCSGR